MLFYELVKEKQKRIYSLAIKLLISLTVLQQFFLQSDFYYLIRTALYLSFFVLATLAATELFKMLRLKEFMIIIAITASIMLMAIVFWALGSGGYTREILSLAIPIGVMYCSMFSGVNIDEAIEFSRYYSILGVLLGIYIVIRHGSGLSITQMYFFQQKNQVGPIIALASIMSLIRIVFLKNRNWVIPRLFDGMLLLFGVILLLVLRNRAGSFALIAIFLIAVVRGYIASSKKVKIRYLQLSVGLLVFLVVTGLLDKSMKFFIDSFTYNYNINDLDSISAGRISGILDAIRVVIRNPLSGEAFNPKDSDNIPHVYLLYKMMQYGVIGSLPLLVLYGYIFYLTLRAVFFECFNLFNAATMYPLLFALIVSVFEYAAPFGPGVSMIMAWYLLGIRLKASQNSRQELIG